MISSGTVARSGEDGLAGAVQRGIGQFLEQRVRFAIRDAIALLDRGPADRLCEMAFAGARWAEEERVFALADEARGRELVQQRPIHLLVKVEIETVERAIGIAEARLFVAPIKEAVLPPLQFVAHERGDEIERRQPLGLGVPQARLQDVGHAREAELAQRAIEFSQIHVGSPVVRSIRSR